MPASKLRAVAVEAVTKRTRSRQRRRMRARIVADNWAMSQERGFLETLAGDGRPLLVLTALTLIGCGAFALFQAATGHFLPHDVEYLGMSAAQLCSLHGCRIVHFMIHDRVSFGGVLLAIGVIYLWL